MSSAATTPSWVDALARLRPVDRARRVPDAGPARRPAPDAAPACRSVPDAGPARPPVDTAQACALTGAKRAKKKCCRSMPRCKGCPVVLLRATRAAESGLTGKQLAKAVKRARAA